MARLSLIWAIFCKEFSEILRDRRTLAVTIIVPLVLYPCLMMFTIRTAELQQSTILARRMVIEVEDSRSKHDLEWIISKSAAAAHVPKPGTDQFVVVVGHTPPQQLGDAIQLSLSPVDRDPSSNATLQVSIRYSEINTHSRNAMEQIRSVIAQYGRLVARHRLSLVLVATEGSVKSDTDLDSLLQPVEVHPQPVAMEKQRGAWFLGMMLPAILVAMAIMSSMYPAIDLTAGERERGTLETLLASPTPVGDIVLGKFLAVVAMGMLTAALNVISVGATFYVGGLEIAAIQELPIRFSFSVLVTVLLCMIPFVMLFAAILIGACSFARTFKEAQSYVTPIGICSLFLAFAVNMPSVRPGGLLLVVPIGNMALLVRELLEGRTGLFDHVTVVLLSTALYAIAALLLAIRCFGQEVIMFGDSRSVGTILARRLFLPTPRPTVTQTLLLTAVLFPITFCLQSLLAQATWTDPWRWLSPIQYLVLFLAFPTGLALYLKVDLSETFSLRLPSGRAWAAALCIGLSSWVLADALASLQARIMPLSPELMEQQARMKSAVADPSGLLAVMLLLSVLAISEEFLFRGFLLSGFRSGMGSWPAIVITSVMFGVFSFLLDGLWFAVVWGAALAYLCWQASSIWPCILAHVLHNVLPVLVMIAPGRIARSWPGLQPGEGMHLPWIVLLIAGTLFCLGLLICKKSANPTLRNPSHDALVNSK